MSFFRGLKSHIENIVREDELSRRIIAEHKVELMLQDRLRTGKLGLIFKGGKQQGKFFHYGEFLIVTEDHKPQAEKLINRVKDEIIGYRKEILFYESLKKHKERNFQERKVRDSAQEKDSLKIDESSRYLHYLQRTPGINEIEKHMEVAYNEIDIREEFIQDFFIKPLKVGDVLIDKNISYPSK